VNYGYNGLGDRLVEGDTQFEMDLNTGLTQALSDETNTYLYGNGRIGQFTGVDSAYFLGDALGSVRQLVDGSGAVSMSKNYKPYGEVLSSEGEAASRYGYTSEMQNSDLVFLRARYYQSLTGRFLTKDTWQGKETRPMSYNAWLYTYDNPINLRDPSGHDPYCEGPFASNEDCVDNRNTGKSPDVRSYYEKTPPDGITFIPGIDYRTL